MKLAFFPGCMIPVKYPQMEAAIRKTLPNLGIEIVDLDGFSCCPDPIHFKAKDTFQWLVLAARNLSIAEKAGLDIFTICSGCTGTLCEANRMLQNDAGLREKVNVELKKVNRRYDGGIKVRHIVNVMRDTVGIEKVAESVTRPLKDVMVAIHYGCHLLKPRQFMDVDDPDNPKIMDRLIRAIGADTCRHQEWYLCCGKACDSDDLKEQMTDTVLKSIREMDADCMGMICPSCFSSFDLGQLMLRRREKAESGGEAGREVPPVYYFQLLGLAQGFSPEEMGFANHKIKPTALLEKAGVGMS